MKRTDEEVRAEALVAYKNKLNRQEKERIEQRRQYFEQLKKNLPDLTSSESYNRISLGGHDFWLETEMDVPELVPWDGWCRDCRVYDMASFGSYLEFQKIQNANREARWQEDKKKMEKKTWRGKLMYFINGLLMDK